MGEWRKRLRTNTWGQNWRPALPAYSILSRIIQPSPRNCDVFGRFQQSTYGMIGAVRALSTNVNQIARQANKTGRVYDDDITTMKESVNAIWQLLSCIRSATQCAEALNTSWTGIRPEVIRLSSLLCARQNLSEQQNNSEPYDSFSEVAEF